MLQNIKQKNDELIKIGEKLKEKFIGIDNVIDQFISSVRVWYVMPDLMNRPLIVNLWGLTGSGKTDLVRSFVKLSGLSRNFIELQMDVNCKYDTLQSMIEYSDLPDDEQSVILLDEFQRFRTKDEAGIEIKQKSLQDVWMLLSDGKFQSESEKKREVLELLLSNLYFKLEEEEEEEGKPKPENKENKKKNYKYKQAHYTSRRLKKLLNLQEPIEDIMKWNDDIIENKAKKALETDAIFEGKAYNKMLIVIAGNIDDAYSMADDISNADTDADVFHEFTKQINIVNIKNALSKRFKPEQVARLGNNHIIYKSLSKNNFENIIKNNIEKITSKIYDSHKIKIVINNSVYRTIYNNGVFPAQGVRPVISTISNIFENYIPIFLLKAIEDNINVIIISYNENEIIGTIGSETISFKVDLVIDKIKKDKSINERILSSIHESGHSVVYAILKAISPTQISSSTSSEGTEGFVGIHREYLSKSSTKDKIAILLAGRAAEEIVFGDDFKSDGALNDIAYATKLASYYIRDVGFDGFLGKIAPSGNETRSITNTNIEQTNAAVEMMMQESKQKAINILNKYKSLFTEVSNSLISYGKLSTNDFIDICSKYGLNISEVSPSTQLICNYQEKWNEFKVI